MQIAQLILGMFEEGGDEMYTNQLNHFFDCVEADGKPKVTIDDGISVA